jgi:hypothetical protein
MNDRERTIAGLTAMMLDHADEPITGACPHCRRHYCQPYAEARAELSFYGVDVDATLRAVERAL